MQGLHLAAGHADQQLLVRNLQQQHTFFRAKRLAGHNANKIAVTAAQLLGAGVQPVPRFSTSAGPTGAAAGLTGMASPMRLTALNAVMISTRIIALPAMA